MSAVRVGTSLPSDVPALKALWAEGFGDDSALIDRFFDGFYTPEGVFVVREDGKVRAMACWWPQTIRRAGREWSAAYLYAVATEAAARGRGHCGRLLAYAGEFLSRRGVQALLLVPGEASLRRFYGRHGYRDFSSVEVSEAEAAGVAGTAETIGPAAYRALRERLLADRAHVAYPPAVLDFQAWIAGHYGGGMLRLERDGQEGCACLALDGEGRAVFYELLWPGDRLEGASLAARAFGAARMRIRAPGEGEPFAMVRWLTEPPALPAPYFGIALD